MINNIKTFISRFYLLLLTVTLSLLLPSCGIFTMAPDSNQEGEATQETQASHTSMTSPGIQDTNGTQDNKEPDPDAILVAGIVCASDKDADGTNDLDDIIEGARKDAENKPRYRDKYYAGGYPPDNEGVCTDVIWRAFKSAGYMLKDMVDEDIRLNLDLYPRVNRKPDPNIDFRRIKNLMVYFKRYAKVLTTEIIPGDPENLKEWQGGDIVVFSDPLEHIAIISDVRNDQGVPLMIHNSGPYTEEEDMLIRWHEHYSPITGHYRFPPEFEYE